MSAQLKDFTILRNETLASGCCLMYLSTGDGSALPAILPGQFVQIKVETPGVFLRRPISICNTTDDGELVLFIKPVGKGSSHLTKMKAGEKVNILLPMGHGFDISPEVKGKRILLAGGGVGAAPLVLLARELSRQGAIVSVALGGRTRADISGIPELYETAERIALSTDDGSVGEKGVITHNSVFKDSFDRIYCCGPTPMMKAVARYAKENKIWCEVSLENSMACGMGACLCCVQDTSDKGNVCTCTEGPVFNINRLEKWI